MSLYFKREINLDNQTFISGSYLFLRCSYVCVVVREKLNDDYVVKHLSSTNQISSFVYVFVYACGIVDCCGLCVSVCACVHACVCGMWHVF